MTRKIKVYEQSMGSVDRQVPTIILKGKWLEKAGFVVGDYVEVVCKCDKIILTKTTPPETKESLEDEFKKLSKKEQEELMKMLKQR